MTKLTEEQKENKMTNRRNVIKGLLAGGLGIFGVMQMFSTSENWQYMDIKERLLSIQDDLDVYRPPCKHSENVYK